MSEGTPNIEVDERSAEPSGQVVEAPDPRGLLFESYRLKAVQALQDRIALSEIMAGWLSGPFDFSPQQFEALSRSHDLHTRELGAALMGLGAVATAEGTC